MADWTKPSVGDQYANFLKYINAKLADVATMFATAPANPLDQTCRWNATTSRFEQYSLSANSWAQLFVSGINIPSVTLSADPTTPLMAATKQYVDALNARITTAQTTANNAMPKTGGLSFTNGVGIDTNALNAGAQFSLNGPKNTNRMVAAYSAYSLRWLWGVDGSTESGGNNGSTWFINRYSDTGVYLGTAFYIARVSGQAVFSTRPSFNGAVPWDSSNLPSPMSAAGGQVTNGDLTLWQNATVGGDLSRLVMVNAVTGLTWRMRLNGSTGALEYINSAYNAVNFTFGDGGNFITRAWLTAGGDLRTNSNMQFLNANNGLYDSNSAVRFLPYVNDYALVRGGGGSGNYTMCAQRNDGANMLVAHGNGDLYYASQGWLTGIINGKAPAGVWHHSATVANCGSGTSIALSTSGNTLQLSLSNTNCNCNCSNCSCFPADSLVLMADGTQKPIQDVRVGEMVAGPMGPAEVRQLDRPILGNRTLLQMGDDSLRWSDEHLLWARNREDGREWWHASNKDRWLFEMNTGHVKGVQDPDRILEGFADFAHVDGFKSNAVQPVANAGPYTQLYLPVTDGSPIIVNGYMVGARVNEFDFNYEIIDWDLDRHYIKEVMENAPVSQ
jgi:hypothetical protein